MEAMIAADIHDFIAAKFPQISFANDQDVFELGFVNSLFAMELVMFIEKNFAMAIPNEDLKISNFRTVDAMAKLVQQHQLAVAERG